jgi:hypothetical protein
MAESWISLEFQKPCDSFEQFPRALGGTKNVPDVMNGNAKLSRQVCRGHRSGFHPLPDHEPFHWCNELHLWMKEYNYNHEKRKLFFFWVHGIMFSPCRARLRLPLHLTCPSERKVFA